MMQRVSGRFFDGRSAAHSDAELAIDAAGRLHLVPSNSQPAASIHDVEISSRLGNIPRRFAFPSGAVFETGDHDTVDEWLRAHGVAVGVAHRLERRWRYTLGALVISAAFIVSAAVWGVPWLSSVLAPVIPQAVVTTVGRETLGYLDELVLENSQLSVTRREEVESLFSDLLPVDSRFDYRLAFRRGDLIDANAFALPDGTIVATDELINLARNDQEIAAILLHEIGHVESRHGLELVLSHSGLAAITMLVFGDVNAAGAVIVALPNVLIGSSYSRKLEREADDFALARMGELGIPAARFADALESLQAYYAFDCEARARVGVLPKRCSPPGDHAFDEGASSDDVDARRSDTQSDGEPSWFDYVSTHPAIAERIARIRANAE